MSLSYSSILRLIFLLANLSVVFSTSPPGPVAPPAIVNIRCLDGLPRVSIRTNQGNCPKVSYGGSFQNAGAYGFRSPEHSALFAGRGWPVRFEPDTSDDSHLRSPHARLLCLERCWSHVSLTEELVRQQYQIIPRQLKDTILIRPGLSRMKWAEPVPIPPGKGLLRVPSIELHISAETPHWWQQPQRRSQFVALHPDSHIICPPTRPDFPIPGPVPGDYSSMQELCATALDGGHLDANMGGYCFPRQEDQAPYLYFDPTLTPSLAMIPTTATTTSMAILGRDARLLLVQLRCFHDCSCASESATPRQDNEQVAVPWMYRTAVSRTINGIRLVSQDGSGETSVTIEYNGDSGQQCSSSRCRPLERHEIARLLRNAMQSPLADDKCDDESGKTCGNREQELYQESKLRSSPECGLKCERNQHCSPDCPHCKVGRPLTEQVGVGFSRLIVFAAGWCAPIPITGSFGSLLPRSDEGLCACNRTYVSMACCDAIEDGIIWEDINMRRGRLELD